MIADNGIAANSYQRERSHSNERAKPLGRGVFGPQIKNMKKYRISP
jgi:hypothetical protein